ncbi:mitogen-activated protein kinase kinase kinase 20-like [Bidens hawaiensis]|uniref:mitogen-activated protein kinase kinase kinase 20-like n=1 Tax=Bidens hawaiensis TaxID=980011 RepID=UPI00404B07BB
MKKRSRITEHHNSKRRKQQQPPQVRVFEFTITNNNNYYYYGDGKAWVRGGCIGKGCFGSVFMATLKKPKSRYSSYPQIMAVKSAEVSASASIQKEREVLNNVKGCRNVIRCFGDEITNAGNGLMVYNLLLEYGAGGTLADLIKRSGDIGLPESDVKRYARSIVRGLWHIHQCGYVHCDLKPDNILLVSGGSNCSGLGCSGSGGDEFVAKIGDLGLAKRAKQSKKGRLMSYWRGTPMYLSPEAVTDGVQEAPADIWAIGCIVLEMLTGSPPWGRESDTTCEDVVNRIGEGNECPPIRSTLSSEAKSFLKGCFVKSKFRLTADMLLVHPFLEGIDDNEEDDDEDDDSGDVYDINAISSLIMSENDDGYSSYSDGVCWSEDDGEGTQTDINSCFSIGEETSIVPPLNGVQYPISVTIASRV